MTDRNQRIVVLAIYAAVTAGTFAAAELCWLALRWLAHHHS